MMMLLARDARVALDPRDGKLKTTQWQLARMDQFVVVVVSVTTS